MTKETKIGLLVGLAFIILFAIILSEKGTPQRSAALPTFTVADGSKSASPLTGSGQPLGSAGRLPITSQLPPIIQPKPQYVAPPSPVIMTEEPVAQVAPRQDDPIGALPDSVVGFLNSMPIKSEPATTIEQPKTEHGTTLNPPAITIPPMVASSSKPESKKSEPAPKIALSTATNEISNTLTASQEPAKPAADKPLIIKTVHTVQPGESLGKIAAKYYGRSTPARVDALYKANHDRLKDTHRVKAQQKLDIPDLGEANSAFEPVSALTLTDAGAIRTPPTMSDTIRIPIPIREQTASAQPSLKKLSPPAAKQINNQLVSAAAPSKKYKSAEASYQWYEVRPKDSLSKIARQQLGSEKHLNELCQLNKDRLGKKNILKPGMKLRIPTKSAASDEPPTAVSSNGFGNEN